MGCTEREAPLVCPGRGHPGGAEGGSEHQKMLTGLSTPKPSSLQKSWNVVLDGGAGLGLQWGVEGVSEGSKPLRPDEPVKMQLHISDI